MPRGDIDDFALVMLEERYLVVLGGFDNEICDVTAGCFIYDCLSNLWSSSPASVNMLESRDIYTAAALGGNIVVCGGRDNYESSLSLPSALRITLHWDGLHVYMNMIRVVNN